MASSLQPKRKYKQTADPHHQVRSSFLPLVITSVLFWIPVAIFAKLAVEVREADPIAIDHVILKNLNNFSTHTWDAIALAVTQTGGTWFVLFATILSAIVIWNSHHKRDALTLIVGVGGVGIINVLLKIVFQRTRPDLWQPLITEHSYSFPSGHAMASSALGLSLIVIFWRTQYRWLVFVTALAYIFFVGLTRLYLGVHYPSDIIAGWCVSFIWILLVRKIIRAFATKIHK